MPNWWVDIFVRAGLVGSEEEKLASEARHAREHLEHLYRSQYTLNKHIEVQEARIQAIEGRRWNLNYPAFRGMKRAKTP